MEPAPGQLWQLDDGRIVYTYAIGGEVKMIDMATGIKILSGTNAMFKKQLEQATFVCDLTKVIKGL